MAHKALARRYVVIGLGGIGSPVAQALVQFLSSGKNRSEVLLVDGDTYEESNRSRVVFGECDNKAYSKVSELGALTRGSVTLLPIPKYITPHNVRHVIENGDVVFLCVDNHATRKCISKHCERLDNVLLISGGNDGVEEGRTGTFGNVMAYERKGGKDITNPLDRIHPEIAHPGDKRPDQLSCLELAMTSAPQLLFTNMAVAAAMLGTFYARLAGPLPYEELYLNILLGNQVAVSRKAKGGKNG